MDGRWLLLAIGLFLAVVITRDLVSAWKHQCFKKSSRQLFDVSRKDMPVIFWTTFAGLVLLVAIGVWLTATTALELWSEYKA